MSDIRSKHIEGRGRKRPKLMIPTLPEEYREAFYERYFESEGWEGEYNLSTGELRRISRYSGLNFMEILNLPYPLFLLLRKDSWIDSWMQNPGGREYLKTLWRLRQTEADVAKVRKYENGGGI